MGAAENLGLEDAACGRVCIIDPAGGRVVRGALPIYAGILGGRRYPKFHIAKRVPCRVRLGSPVEMLWAEHKRLMREFDALSGRLDGRLSLGKPADVSLLDLKLEIAGRLLGSCCFCERRCGVDREHGERGECGVGKDARVASVFRDVGEPLLLPSLAVSFAGCNFHCSFCKDWEVSQFPLSHGESSAQDIAKKMDAFPDVRCVAFGGGEPAPNLHALLEVLSLYGRNVPVVLESNMYMSSEAMELLDGVVDVFVSDFKYGSDLTARRFSGVEDYFSVVTRNNLLARRSAEVVVRILFMPGDWASSDLPRIVGWLSENCRDVAVRLVRQYRPEYKARSSAVLCRKAGLEEFVQGLGLLEKSGLVVL